MVVTRSAGQGGSHVTRSARTRGSSSVASPEVAPNTLVRRKTATGAKKADPLSVPSPRKKAKPTPSKDDEPARALLPEETIAQHTTVPAPRLPFHLEDAVQHLIKADGRFAKLLAETTLKPFSEMEQGLVKEINVYKYLGHSILGQQISWKAARSVIYKFCRLFFPHELPDPANLGASNDDGNTAPQVPRREDWPWPTPHQVLRANEQDLRSAGLSGQKVKYILDASRHFADGRLDAKSLLQSKEEEAIDSLVQIKGVGVWTAEMLLMFALRLPNLLPVGDLGIQRGMLHFFLCSSLDDMVVHPAKARHHAPASSQKKRKDGLNSRPEPEAIALDEKEARVEATVEASEKLDGGEATAVAPKLAPELAPPPDHATALPPLPPGLSLATLRHRATGNKVKGQYLTPDEMRLLTEAWEPYRSVGAYLMYALKD